MSGKGKRLHVVPGENGWVVKPEKQRPVSTAPTQAAAEKIARDLLNASSNGGEVITHRPTGEIRSVDTINRRDPNPPKDREH